MKIFLDDVRDPPDDSWILCRSPWSFMEVLIRGWNQITHISFDHDLGSEHPYYGEITGYNCLCMIEHMQDAGSKVAFEMSVHSANPVGIARMNSLIRRIKEREE